MVKVENNNTYNVGDRVWWFDAYGTLRKGDIYEIRPEEGHNKVPVALIHEDGKQGLQTGAMLEDCWPSKLACVEAEMKRSELQQEEYKESIKDVKDLVNFLFKHDVVSENQDHDAKNAALDRAYELGIEVGKEDDDDFVKAINSMQEGAEAAI